MLFSLFGHFLIFLPFIYILVFRYYFECHLLHLQVYEILSTYFYIGGFLIHFFINFVLYLGVSQYFFSLLGILVWVTILLILFIIYFL